MVLASTALAALGGLNRACNQGVKWRRIRCCSHRELRLGERERELKRDPTDRLRSVLKREQVLLDTPGYHQTLSHNIDIKLFKQDFKITNLKPLKTFENQGSN